MGKLLNSLALVAGLGLVGAGVVDGYKDYVSTSKTNSDTRVSRVFQLRHEMSDIPSPANLERIPYLMFSGDPEAVYYRKLANEYTSLIGNDSVAKDVREYDHRTDRPPYGLLAIILGGIVAYTGGRELCTPKEMESVVEIESPV